MPFIALDPSTATAIGATTAGAPLAGVGETLSTIRAELLLQLGARSDVDVPRLNKWINKGYRAVASMIKLRELSASLRFNLVVGQPFYLLPIQIRSIKGLSISDKVDYPNAGRTLILSNEDEYRRQADLSGTPQNYFRIGKSRMLVVYPTPDALYPMDLEFWVRPDDLTDDGHSPILPSEFHESITLKAKQIAWRALRNYKESQIAGNDFLTEIRPIIDTDAEEESEAPSGLTVVRKASDLFRARR